MTGLASSTFYYQPKSDPSERQRRDAELRDVIEAIKPNFPVMVIAAFSTSSNIAE